MEILLITDDFYPNLGGVAHTLMNLYKFIEEKGHTLYVFNPYHKGRNIFRTITFLRNYTIRDLINSVRIKKLHHYVLYSFWKIIQDKNIRFSHRLRIILHFLIKPRVLLWVIENVIQIYPYLKKLNYNVIVGGNSYEILELNFVLSRLFHKKLIAMAHGDDFLIPRSIIFKTLYNKSLYFKYADKIILSNNIVRKLIKKIHNLDESKLEVISRAINIKDLKIEESKNQLREEFNIPENQFIILSVGVHRYIKRFDLVIQAVHKIKEKNPKLDIKYYLIGSGIQTPMLKKLTRDLKLENEVKFLGRCDIETRNKFYKLSDVFVMPSISTKSNIEGFGITFIEANYYKLPVIGTRSGGIPAVIKDGENGILIRQNDVAELVKNILFLYNHEEMRAKMGENGHNRVINDYSWHNIINEYIKVFESLL